MIPVNIINNLHSAQSVYTYLFTCRGWKFSSRHSWQKLCPHAKILIGFLYISKQIAHDIFDQRLAFSIAG